MALGAAFSAGGTAAIIRVVSADAGEAAGGAGKEAGLGRKG